MAKKIKNNKIIRKTNTSSKKKKYLKIFDKKQFVTFIVSTIFMMLVFIFFFVFTNLNYYKLYTKGYGIKNISIINSYLDDKEISILINSPFIKNIGNYITTSDFISSNIIRYYNYNLLNNDISYEDTVTHVNIGLDRKHYSDISKAKQLGNLTLVNKYRSLSENYIPNDLESVNSIYTTSEIKLTKEAKSNFEKMCEEALLDNIKLLAYSGYRSYNYQTYTYNTNVKKYGSLGADNISARSGHSEHQLGLAIDITNEDLEKNKFETTKEYEWLINNSYKYGFILRYKENKETIQQYDFEPWHYRYVGIKVANDLYNNYKYLTYDEYYYRILKEN